VALEELNQVLLSALFDAKSWQAESSQIVDQRGSGRPGSHVLFREDAANQPWL
jgi:hypothetical protein